MTTWKDLKSRRRIRVPEFLEFKKIKDREGLVSYLQSVGVQPPTPDEMDEIFGKVVTIETKAAETVAKETSRTSTRSTSGSGDTGGVPSDGTVSTQATSGSA